MQSHDVFHTGRSNLRTENVTGTEIWRVTEEIFGLMEGAPIIDDQGIIYFGANSHLYAFYANGTKKWKYESDGTIWATPAIAEDGTIIFPTWGGYGTVHAVCPNGTVKWTYRDGYETQSLSSPAIGTDGTIYFGSDDSPNYNIYAINANGTLRWKYSTGYITNGAPAIAPDGTIYIGSGDHHLYAMNPNGTLRWWYDTGSDIKGGATIASDGTIYVPAFNSYFYALTPNGELLWKGYTGDSVAAAGLALAENGTIYVGTERLRAYSPDGTLKWTADLPGDVYGTVPAVSADGTIYVSAGDYLVAMNPDGTIRWNKNITNDQIRSSPSIGPGNRVYVGSNPEPSDNWFFHAFGLGLLRAEAQGPYQGTALITKQFVGIAFGGTLPYSYHWDFGDGSTSSELEPTHTYQDGGYYTATFTLTDANGNQSTDTASVTMDYPLPSVTLLKPKNWLYISNHPILPTKYLPIIIGPITIEADANQEQYGIKQVEFYITDTLQFTDTEPPFTWTWKSHNILPRYAVVTVKAYDNQGRSTNQGIDVIQWL
jgi:large repetitive protein